MIYFWIYFWVILFVSIFYFFYFVFFALFFFAWLFYLLFTLLYALHSKILTISKYFGFLQNSQRIRNIIACAKNNQNPKNSIFSKMLKRNGLQTKTSKI